MIFIISLESSMPEISRFYGIIFAMFFDDHNPPHFHARYAGDKVTTEIESLRMIEGHIPPWALGLVIEWATQHKGELLNNWKLAKNNQTPNKIELTFEDGATGVVDFSKYLSKGGVFEKFKDIEFYKNLKFMRNLGCWHGEMK